MLNLFKKRLNYQRLTQELFDLLIKVFYFLPALIIVAMTRLLRPFILIRFARLESDRIGHFAWNTEMYLCERDKGIAYNGKRLDIFYCQRKISNHYLKKMWGRVLLIFPLSGLIATSVYLNRFLPGSQAYELPLADNYIDKQDFFNKTLPHIHFTERENQRGEKGLKNMGILDNSPFVCLHARDSAYLSKVLPLHDWSYHDYRNSDINSYGEAAEKLTQRGYFIVRMGALVNKPFHAANPKIIDYASCCRSDFMDIYLSAKCSFFVGSVSGIDEVPRLFRRKVVYVNCVPLEFIFSWNPSELFIPKKLWLRSEGRFLTFRETIATGIGSSDKTQAYVEAGIELMDNSPQEIASVAEEMDARIKGEWHSSGEDEELQRRFWEILKASNIYRKVNTRLGAEFLRQNTKLLD